MDKLVDPKKAYFFFQEAKPKNIQTEIIEIDGRRKIEQFLKLCNTSYDVLERTKVELETGYSDPKKYNISLDEINIALGEVEAEIMQIREYLDLYGYDNFIDNKIVQSDDRKSDFYPKEDKRLLSHLDRTVTSSKKIEALPKYLDQEDYPFDLYESED